MAFSFETGARTVPVTSCYEAGQLRLVIDGRVVDAQLEAVAGERDVFFLDVDGKRERIFLIRDGNRFWVHVRGESFEFEALSALELLRKAARLEAGSGVVLAPMPGVVVELLVAEGDDVERGAPLLVIESMKLQTQIEADASGRVVELPLAAGSSFEQGAMLARVECPDETVAAEPGQGASQ